MGWCVIWSVEDRAGSLRVTAVCPAKSQQNLWFGSLPHLVETIPGFVAGLAVFGPEVHRLAFDRPLPGAVVTRDDRVVARRLVGPAGHQWRPVACAWSIANRFAAVRHVLVKRIKRHAVGANQYAVGNLWLGLRQRCITPQDDQRHGNSDLRPGARSK